MKKMDPFLKKYHISQPFLSLLLSEDRYTENTKLAIALAKRTGKKPIEFINPHKRKLFLAAYPELRGEKTA